MRRAAATVVALLALGASPAVGEDAAPPPAPSTAPDEAAWKKEAAALEKRAAKAESEQRNEEARALRASAVEIAREHGRESAELAQLVSQLGMSLNALGRYAEALPLHEESLAIRRRLYPGDHATVATSLGNVAHSMQASGRVADALPVAEQSLAMWRRLHSVSGRETATGLTNLAWILLMLGRGADALPRLEEALAIHRRVHTSDHTDLAGGINNLAHALDRLGRAGEALPLHEESLAMLRRMHKGDHPHVAASLNNVALALQSLGRLTDAVPRFEEALRMLRRLFVGDHPRVAQTLDNTALAYAQMGRAAEALPLQEEAVAMRGRLFKGDHPSVAVGLNNYGLTLESLGRLAEAVALYESVVAMRRRLHTDDHPYLALAVANLGYVLEASGRVQDALPMKQEALAMYRRIHGRGHPDLARSIGNVAFTLMSLDRAAESLPLQEESLAMYQALYSGDHADVARSLFNLARTLELLGRATESEPRYQSAFTMSSSLSAPDRRRAGVNLASFLMRQRRPADAVAPLQAAVEALESQRSSARGLGAEDRSRFVAAMLDSGDPYSILIRAHLSLSDPKAAVETLERARGREMLDLLGAADADSTTLARERARAAGDSKTLADLDSAAAARQTAEADVTRRAIEADRGRTTPDLALDALRTLVGAETKARRDLLSALAAERRLVRDVLPETKPLATREIQALLGADERLIAYSISSDDGYLLLVGPQSVEALRLRADGEHVTLQTVAPTVDAYRDALTDSTADLRSAVVPAGRRLSSMLLPAKLFDELRGLRRVYVMPEGPLEGVPFETLVVGEKDGQPVFWADVGPPIAYELSGSVLSWLRKRPAGGEGGPDLVAVGDPVFAGAAPAAAWPKAGVLLTEVMRDGQASKLGLRPGDVLVAYDGKPVADAAALRAGVEAAGKDRTDIPLAVVRDGERSELKAASGLLGVGVAQEPPDAAGPKLLGAGQIAIALRSAKDRASRLTALPGTRSEVNAIAAAFRSRLGDNARVITLLGKDARESAILDAAKSPRFLHFATHGLIDESETASFSSLALTMPTVPVVGDDGFLTLIDLFRRWQGRLKGTELVVLSACESARGKQHRHEGAYALPWGFLFAGARAVVASQWKVDDEATAFLMSDFYRRLLDGDGQDPLAALSAARLATKAKWPHPKYWGAFVFAGAPR